MYFVVSFWAMKFLRTDDTFNIFFYYDNEILIIQLLKLM